MTNAVANIIHELEKLPEAEQNDLAQWLKDEIAARHARSHLVAGSLRVEEIKQHEYGIPVAVSPKLVSGNGACAAQPVVTISGIELLWLELLREDEGGE